MLLMTITEYQLVRTPESTYKILDVQFLSNRQIICTSIRMIDGKTYPCIDIYDLPELAAIAKPQVSDPSVGLIGTQTLLDLPLVTSFRLPRLKSTQSRCVWSRDPGDSDRIVDFALTLSSPSSNSFEYDQVLTFQIQAQVRDSGVETLRGVVLLSKLLDISKGVISNAWTMLALPNHLRQFGAEQLHVKWAQWSSAVSLNHDSPSTIPKPIGTQIAELSLSPSHSSCAVLIIRDYNQRLLRAPKGHWNRNLGQPTQNCVSLADKLSPPELFELATAPKSLRSLLFGGTVHFGLGHRKRVIKLGTFRADISSSGLFWDGDSHMTVVSPTGGVSLSLRS